MPTDGVGLEFEEVSAEVFGGGKSGAFGMPGAVSSSAAAGIGTGGSEIAGGDDTCGDWSPTTGASEAESRSGTFSILPHIGHFAALPAIEALTRSAF